AAARPERGSCRGVLARRRPLESGFFASVGTSGSSARASRSERAQGCGSCRPRARIRDRHPNGGAQGRGLTGTRLPGGTEVGVGGGAGFGGAWVGGGGGGG